MRLYIRPLIAATLMILVAIVYDFTIHRCMIEPYGIEEYSMMWWWMSAPTLILTGCALVILFSVLYFLRRDYGPRTNTLEWEVDHDTQVGEHISGWHAKSVLWRDKFSDDYPY